MTISYWDLNMHWLGSKRSSPPAKVIRLKDECHGFHFQTSCSEGRAWSSKVQKVSDWKAEQLPQENFKQRKLPAILGPLKEKQEIPMVANIYPLVLWGISPGEDMTPCVDFLHIYVWKGMNFWMVATQIFLIFTPNLREMIQFYFFFQMGWFNHQLDLDFFGGWWLFTGSTMGWKSPHVSPPFGRRSLFFSKHLKQIQVNSHPFHILGDKLINPIL